MADRSVPVVATVGLCKTFKDFWRRPRVEAVRDLSLEIKPGEVFGLLGPNGSGKTTTIKMLLGLLYPTRGRISMFGKAPTDVSVKSRIGFLPEESYLYRFLVARETLDFFGRLFRIPSRIRKERTERLLDMVGLRHEAKRRVGEYSKGMARRIGLAQALINDPEFLILDEPTAGLDPIGARQIKDVIRTLGRKGKTILLSSHMLADVEDVCDRVVILYGGQQRAAGDIGDLLRKRDVTQITTPELSEGTLEQVRSLIQKLESKDILEVSHPHVALEDFFLRIVQDAQAANISTSGARAGGDIPEFLEKPTGIAVPSVTSRVVDSLVTAASEVRVESVSPDAGSDETLAHPVREILNELIESAAGPSEHGDSVDPADSGEASANAASSASSDADSSTAVRSVEVGDETVINALLEHAGDGDEASDEANDAPSADGRPSTGGASQDEARS